ncbi:MAG: hypothetical protein KID00_14115 [Clostridium argentinense]|uniref:DUF7922 domain-containing protein n=1 Tax=Clostridium faecium TaxID=2762223 RepID=A0ABR8YVM7_9CLOT|nr:MULTISPECIES: hypothetical protein [Clostridium]MBD8048192.1 hypothetical protein [Clostridium faecium]MBS5824960.1 hypothetical protein [Clostridium argentinense]MDU1348630.1 hypothetical protein [Clostridium argentinense]
MTPKKSYSRFFIILQEDEKGYSLDQDKAPSGYAKLEMKNNKCKLSYYVQNVNKQKGPCHMVLICDKKDTKNIIKIAKMNIDDYGRADVTYEYDMNNIANTGIGADKIAGAAIVKFDGNKITCVMHGFITSDISKEWKQYKIASEENNNIVEKESVNATEEKNINTAQQEESMVSMKTEDKFDKYEQQIEAEKENNMKENETNENRADVEILESDDEMRKKKHKSDCECKEKKKEKKEYKDDDCKEEKKEHHKEHEHHHEHDKEKDHCDDHKFKDDIKYMESKYEYMKKPCEYTEDDYEFMKDNKKIKKDCDYYDYKVKKDFNYGDEKYGYMKEDCSHMKKSNDYKMKKEWDCSKKDYGNINDFKNKYYDNIIKDCDYMGKNIQDNQFNMEQNNYNYEKNPKSMMTKFFKDIVKDFEKMDKYDDIKNCVWYKVPVEKLEEMYCMHDYKKYTVIYYPMICYYPYIAKHKHFMIGHKYDNNGNLKYIVYALPGKKSESEQPYGGRTGFVAWMPNKNDTEMGYWLMFYDFKNSTVVVPVKR